jgi:hypothetical protein
VSFSGGSFLGGSELKLPEQFSAFAVIRDTGTTSTYGSGIFFSAGADNGVNTRAAVEGGPLTKDDDSPPMGSGIIATMLDWSGSPAAPGHRDLHNKPVVLSIVYSDVSTVAYVDGCVELEDGAQGSVGSGFM